MTGNQIVKEYYDFILERCRFITFGDKDYKDFAHDICSTILEYEQERIDVISINPIGYINQMCITRWIDVIRGRKVRQMYLQNIHVEKIQNIYSQLDAEEILSLAQLSEYDATIIASCMIHSNAMDLKRASNIDYKTANNYIKYTKNKIKSIW